MKNDQQFLIFKNHTKYSKFVIKPIFRWLIKEDSKKIMILLQSIQRNPQNFVNTNNESIKS